MKKRNGMLFGAHVSIAGGLGNAPKRAHDLGCECFQIFTRPPHGGKAPLWDTFTAQRFQDECAKYGFTRWYIHTPYILNLASLNNKTRYGSMSIIKEDLQRANLIGAAMVVTHLGSANAYEMNETLAKTAEGITKILDGYSGNALLLMEFAAGAGNIIGSSIEQMKIILERVDDKYLRYLKICLDTAHVFASGIDLRTKADARAFLKEFDREIGLSRLAYIHANDSKVGLGEKKDRHEHLGKGKIGLECFRTFVGNARERSLQGVDMVVETPTLEGMKKDIALLKKMRK